MKQQSYVYYSPPKGSVYGHFVRSKNHQKTALQLQHVVKHLGNHKDDDHGQLVNLRLHEIVPTSDLTQRKKCIDDITDRFGSRDLKFARNSEDVFALHDWNIPFNKLMELIDYQTKNKFPNLHVSYSYYFHWKTKGMAESVIMVQFFDNRFLATTILHFPYYMDQRKLIPFLKELNEALPFKLSPKHFRYAIPNKSNEGFSIRKIDSKFAEMLLTT